MAKKMLHRIVVVWCLYGLVRFCIWLNPLVFRVARILDSSLDPKDGIAIFMVWFSILVIAFVAVLIFTAIHAFSNWFFNEKE